MSDDPIVTLSKPRWMMIEEVLCRAIHQIEEEQYGRHTDPILAMADQLLELKRVRYEVSKAAYYGGLGINASIDRLRLHPDHKT